LPSEIHSTGFPLLRLEGFLNGKCSVISVQWSAKQEDMEDFARLLAQVRASKVRISLFLLKADGWPFTSNERQGSRVLSILAAPG